VRKSPHSHFRKNLLVELLASFRGDTGKYKTERSAPPAPGAAF
jgi:hypothetical protein